MEADGSVIELEDAYYTYPGGTEAIRGVNLRFGPGEVVALVGENGSGKTTLAKLAIGLLRPSRGRVLVNGLDTRKATTYQLARQAGMVFQNPDHQIFERTVFDEVAFAPRNYRLPQEKIAESVQRELSRFELDPMAQSLPAALSGGERKRVAFASSFVLNPSVLFLDEPTKGMEHLRKVRLAEMARDRARTGGTTVFVTHDTEFASQAADRVVVMHRGRVLLNGSTREVLADERIADAGLLPTQLQMLASGLRDLGVPRGILDPEEFCEFLLGLLK